MKAGDLVHQHQVPLRIDFYSERGHSEMNLFNFDAESVKLSAFDVRSCFGTQKQLLIYFQLEGE